MIIPIKINKTKKNSNRQEKKLDKALLCKTNKIKKSLILKYKFQQGRSLSTGHITSWHRGGKKKNSFRNLKTQFNYYSLCVAVCYDPRRTSFISFNFDFYRKKFFINLACAGCYSGSFLISNFNFFNFNLGLQTVINQIPPGTIVHNLILTQNIKDKKKYIKSAGTFGQIIQKDYIFAKIKLPSGTIKKISVRSIVTVGIVSNQNNSLIVFGNAGSKRNIGRRPIVRGIAMNPVDHPHGGRTNGGKISVTPWGLPTKNKFYLGKK